jgi:hypothetical protein
VQSAAKIMAIPSINEPFGIVAGFLAVLMKELHAHA